MRENSSRKKRRNNSYNTICTILGTLLVVAIVWVISLAWNTIGKKVNEVSYSAGETEFAGSLPASRKFEPGDEVVVRAAEFSAADKEFVGWKDANDVLDYASDILVNGTVFIMPEADVLLEAVWEDDTAADDTVASNTASGKSDSNAEIYHINAGKDYVNVRDNHGYDSKVIAKISDTDVDIEYNGEFEEVYDEDDEKSYDWYFVEIPSKDIEGWIRSDLLTKASSKSASKSDSTESAEEDDSNGEKYLKSHKYDVALMHEDANSSSDVLEKIEDDETILYFNNKSEETTDSDGDTTTWYFVKNSESGKSGWIDSKRLMHAE